MSITSIRLADDVDQPLDFLAKKLDRSKNYLINQAIKEFLAKQSLEDSRWQDTLEALAVSYTHLTLPTTPYV